MARPVQKFPVQNFSFSTTSVSYFFVLIAIFSVLSIVTSLCVSRKSKKSQINEEENHFKSSVKKSVSKLNSNIGEKALLMVKMISWKKVKGEEEEDYDDGEDEEEVWRKTIMMGERCRPLEFSGKILYDSEGNLLPGSPYGKQSKKLDGLATSQISYVNI